MKKNFSNRGFKLSLILGVFLILLVMVVGISFFWAIYSTQVDRRKDFLGQQTDLAGRGLENELDRFEEESTIFLGELEEHTAKNRQDELGKLARKINAVLYTLDSSKKVEREALDSMRSVGGELAERLEEIEKTNSLMIDRELKMIDLKKEIEVLKSKK